MKNIFKSTILLQSTLISSPEILFPGKIIVIKKSYTDYTIEMLPTEK